MTPETLTCDKCGAVKRIETDDEKYKGKIRIGIKMTFYQRTRKRQLKLAAEYRAAHQEEINRKQRERYASDKDYRDYQINYQREYRRIY